MGGGGGGSFGSGFGSRDLQKELREAEESLQTEAFKTQLGELLASLLRDYNDRDVDLVRQRLDEIIQATENLVEGKIELVFGGSVAKHTYIEGLSDIDCLLLLNEPNLDSQNPRDILTSIANDLKSELGENVSIEVGRLAVSVSYGDGMEIQLLPAIRADAVTKIPSSTVDGGWSKIDPEKFRGALTKYNDQCAGKLVPTIKLAKAIIGGLPDNHQLSGYHIESLAIDAFKNYSGPMTAPAMLPYFFEQAKDRVLRPMTDSTGQSVHVDEYMGEVESAARINAGHILGRIWKRMANASATGSLPQWKDLFEEDV